MSKSIIGYLVLLLVCMNQDALAQHAGFGEVKDKEAFKKNFAIGAKNISSIKSSFAQEKNLSMLSEKIVSQGKFWFKREQKVRIEYEKPFRYLLLINGDQILIRDDQKESKMSAHSNKLFQQINRIIVDCLSGSILENKDFAPKVFQSDKMYLLEMSPVAKGIKEFFQTIIVLVNKEDWSVTSIQMNEPGGDNTIIRFSDKALNQKLDDTLFTR